jgi:hypothetical protein
LVRPKIWIRAGPSLTVGKGYRGDGKQKAGEDNKGDHPGAGARLGQFLFAAPADLPGLLVCKNADSLFLPRFLLPDRPLPGAAGAFHGLLARPILLVSLQPGLEDRGYTLGRRLSPPLFHFIVIRGFFTYGNDPDHPPSDLPGGFPPGESPSPREASTRS